MLRPEIEKDPRVLTYLLYDMNPCIKVLSTELFCLAGAIEKFLQAKSFYCIYPGLIMSCRGSKAMILQEYI